LLLRAEISRKRYSGDVVSEEEAAACIRSAEALLSTLIDWLKQNRKEWAP
jgi:hypothetical protein